MRVRGLRSDLVLLFCLVLCACTRPNSQGNSKLVIVAPEAFGKVGALATLPTNRKACFGVNVTADDISGAAPSTCSPATGVVAGFKTSEEKIEASVKKGTSRKIDLYMYLQKEGVNQPCPSMGSRFASSMLSDLFLVASKSGVDFVNEVTEVEMTISFAGVANSLASSYPASCMAGNSSSSYPIRIASDVNKVTGAGLMLRARVGAEPGGVVISGGGLKLHVK